MQTENISPYDRASWLSIMIMDWVRPILQMGNSRPLEFSDMPELPSGDNSHSLKITFQRNWDQEILKPNPSFALTLWKSYRKIFVIAGILKLIHDIVMFFGPLALQLLVSYVENPEDHKQGYAVGICFALLACQIVESVTLRHYFFLTFRTGLQLRSTTITAVYEKSLKLSVGARAKYSSGQISNLMSVDSLKFQILTGYLHTVWSGPFQIIVSLVMLAFVVGWAFLAGLVVLLIMIPISSYVATKVKVVQMNIMSTKDVRIKCMEEILSGMKVIKLQAWEYNFIDKVQSIRTTELKHRFKMIIYQTIVGGIWQLSSALVSAATYGFYILPGNKLTVSVAFTSLSLFNILRFPIAMLPQVINNIIESRVSFARVESFLLAQEITPVAEVQSTPSISINDASFGWPIPTEQQNLVREQSFLSHLIFECRAPELVAIVGQVSSGKTTFISGILGEAYLLHGTVTYSGRIAYVPQIAYIQNATLRDNILFGHPYDEERYQNIIRDCALVDDLRVLPNGDYTEIGEKGINLSGGQRARVSLARAAYSSADIILLDDPLSAVDVHVGRHLFERCIKTIFRDKLVILVTNAIEFLDKVDRIIVINNRTIEEQGKYSELIKRDGILKRFVDDLRRNRREAAQESEERRLSEITIIERQSSHLRDNRPDLIVEETHIIGQVNLSVYFSYIKSYGSILVICGIIFLYLLSEGLLVFINIWTQIWTADTTNKHSNTYYILYYLLITVISMFVTLVCAYCLRYCGLTSARNLHSGILNNIMLLPMSFFDTTPQGRITNRFSKDIEVIDQTLPDTFSSLLIQLFRVLSTAIVIIYATPWFTFVLIPVALVYYYAQHFYIKSSREIKRLESISTSPIYAHFTETLDGVSSIRAYKDQERFILTNEGRVNENQKSYFMTFATNCWLALYLEFAGTLVVFFAAILAILNRNDPSYSGIAALSITYALNVTQSLNWLVRMASDMETNIVSAERIEEYTKLDREATLVRSDITLDPSWPQSGHIIFNNVSMKYRPDLPYVLRNLSFEILPSAKIGIVGRTGSGKTSLLVTLMRIIEYQSEVEGGGIFIDNINIKSIGLHDLRKKVAVIPQEPVLFDGTVRDNLDPFNIYTDEQIWETLERTNSRQYLIENGGLGFQINERGSNLSVGQRQLLCIARALLRNAKIIILDEATAAIDISTDALIQDTISRAFSRCTVLTVAHRINTIINSDKVLVMDDGQIREYDEPHLLLQDESSLFTKLYNQYMSHSQQ